MKSAAPKGPKGEDLLPGMIEAAHRAGRILHRYWSKNSPCAEDAGGGLRVSEKQDAGLVTNADLESELAVVKTLRKLRPDFGFLTEEETVLRVVQGDVRGRWIIDPLDGTTNFVHGFPMFCVSIAAEWDGKVIAGVIYHPILKDTYAAARGKGATLNGRPLCVSKTGRIEDSLLTTGFTYRKNQWLATEMEAFEDLSKLARAIRRPGSAALDLAYTARGVFDGFWERRLSAWDVAAGGLLVTEAGGKVTDFFGKPHSLDAPAILASNSKLHAALLQHVGAKKQPTKQSRAKKARKRTKSGSRVLTNPPETP